jgi:hypothetical protein
MSQLRRLRRIARERESAVDPHTASRLALCVRLGIIDRVEHASILASIRAGYSVDDAITRARLDEHDETETAPIASLVH